MKTPTSILMLLIGVGIGFGLGRLGSGSAGESAETANQTETAKRERASAGGNERKKQLESLVLDRDRFEERIEEIELADIPLMLEILSQKAGIKGLDWNGRSTAQWLLQRWYGESPDAAIAWIEGSSNPGDRQFYFEALAKAELGRDVESAIKLIETHLANSDSKTRIDLPYGLFEAAAKQSPDLFLRACATGISKNRGGSGSPARFPIGFDFQNIMGRLADMAAEMEEGERFSSLPTNLLEEWTKEDPQAAFEWALASEKEGWQHKLVFNSGLDAFFESYAEFADAEDYATFSAEVFAMEKPTKETWRTAWEALDGKPEDQVIETFLDQVAVDGNRIAVLERLLDTTSDYSGGSYDGLRLKLFSKLSVDDRVRYLKRAPEGIRQELGRSLIRHGFSAEEIQAIISQ